MKYLVTESTAQAVRRFAACYLQPDDFAATQPDNAYPVHSLYLDSPDLTTYQAVQTGERNRFKLRIRYYTDQDDAVYFEIKRRTNDTIHKLRAKVRRDAVDDLLAWRPPMMSHLVKPDVKQFFALQEFCRLMHTLGATPRSHVAYSREAWMSPENNSMRITYDRQVQCEPEFESSLLTRLDRPVTPFGNSVVLELKFVDRLPNWCIEMVQLFSLRRGGAPKYAQGVVLLGEERLANRWADVETHRRLVAPVAAPRQNSGFAQFASAVAA
jgi:hypothetical protein